MMQWHYEAKAWTDLAPERDKAVKATIPNAARCARIELMTAVCCAIKHDRLSKSTA